MIPSKTSCAYSIAFAFAHAGLSQDLASHILSFVALQDVVDTHEMVERAFVNGWRDGCIAKWEPTK